VIQYNKLLVSMQELGYYIGAIAILLLANVLMSAVACTDQLKAGVVNRHFPRSSDSSLLLFQPIFVLPVIDFHD